MILHICGIWYYGILKIDNISILVNAEIENYSGYQYIHTISEEQQKEQIYSKTSVTGFVTNREQCHTPLQEDHILFGKKVSKINPVLWSIFVGGQLYLKNRTKLTRFPVFIIINLENQCSFIEKQ